MGAEGVNAIYADASGSVGWSAWMEHRGTVFITGGEWNAASVPIGIAEKELYASSAGLVTLAPLANAVDIYNFTDNMVSLAAMRSGKAYAPRLQTLVERRSHDMLSMGIREAAERVGTKSNLWADLGSRGRVADVFRQARRLGLSPVWVAPAAGWESIEWLLLTPPSCEAELAGAGRSA